jgi:hypothetical protein
MKLLKNLLLQLFIISCLPGCFPAITDNASEQIVPTDTIALATKDTASNSPSDIADYFYFPPDTPYSAKVLTVGQFHEDEVWATAKEEQWFGLFKRGAAFYVAPTRISTTKVFDPIVDEDSLTDRTGWDVKAMNEDSCLILVSGYPLPDNKKVIPVTLANDKIYPGDTVSFNYLGVQYKLYATGTKKKMQDDPLWFDVWNYRLYLEATKDGKLVKELLAAQPNFDDNMISVVFAGDVDGDGLLDLILDTSRHYNMLSPTLYLSKPAGKDQLLKVVGQHISVGC